MLHGKWSRLPRLAICNERVDESPLSCLHVVAHLRGAVVTSAVMRGRLEVTHLFVLVPPCVAWRFENSCKIGTLAERAELAGPQSVAWRDRARRPVRHAGDAVCGERGALAAAIARCAESVAAAARKKPVVLTERGRACQADPSVQAVVVLFFEIAKAAEEEGGAKCADAVAVDRHQASPTG